MSRDTTALGTDYAIVRTFHNAPPLQTVEAPRFTVHAFIGGLLVLISIIAAVWLAITAFSQTPREASADRTSSAPAMTHGAFEAGAVGNWGQG